VVEVLEVKMNLLKATLYALLAGLMAVSPHDWRELM
jgi:hypothetical protein